MKRTLAGCMAIAVLALSAGNIRADIIQLDFSDPSVPLGFRGVFLEAEEFWEERLVDFSAELPEAVRSQLGPILITPTIAGIDGPFQTLAFAGPTEVFEFGGGGNPKNGGTVGSNQIAIAQAGAMTVDEEDIPFMQAAGILVDVIIHEMGHILGFGTLWEDNGLTQAFGNVQHYVGEHGLNKYREESGEQFAQYIPLETAGGAGTAGGHWSERRGVVQWSRRRWIWGLLGWFCSRPVLSDRYIVAPLSKTCISSSPKTVTLAADWAMTPKTQARCRVCLSLAR